ncbi:hypothetical protein BaRGS_00012228 [Batillaria attramentaria]|uniref:Uncharacterized protein n=1 Tax=Batillaria attramentaria TaxID=370345 RepID=A0ABD0LBS4_9CAEN
MVLSEHGVSIDAANHRVNQTPAHIAAEHNRLHCLHWLVTRGAATARQLSCLRTIGCKPGIASVASSQSRLTPVHLAAESGHAQCLHWLLQRGNGYAQQDNMGDTPLHKAVRNGNLECVALLIPHGPAISLENHSGQTPLDVARISQQAECAAHLQRAMASQQTGIGLPMSSPGVNQHVSSSATLVPNSSPDILMNGEPIYINQGGEAMVATGTEQVMETEDVMESCVSSVVVPAHTAGVKRSLDDGDDSNFKRQRCFEPVKGTNFQHHAESPVHVSLQPSPISYKPGLPPDRVDTPYVGTSSMLEHCHSLQAQYGYDSSFINSVVTTNHGS